ncbi:MAG TPA: saccharopine dehydrogenase NADP-binding domain-containing protein, partial [Vicinamibacteria bacterium]|nr:saccharopine dehydrogenase NADP-binding domain-containing protein [Vicinamibacteria bacterium]
MTGPWLLYGANGYTGELVARRAVARGHRPVLGGRRADAVCALAEELQLERRLFGLDDPARVDDALGGMSVVLHCAGPFSRTAKPMAEACLRTRTHYLDITGEVGVFEELAARDAEARAARVMLLPGCGFEVVPSDCLAVHLKSRLPGARRLALAYAASGGVSRGTARTAIEGLGRGGLVRRGGALSAVPSASKTRRIDFGDGPRAAITLPLGDIVTAWHSTGIPDIEVYFAAPPGLRALAVAARYAGS